MIKTFCSIILLTLFSSDIIFSQSESIGLYTFGHSLIDHRPPATPTPSDETTILHWMYLIAEEADQTFLAGGQYGFLTNHANLPPSPNWGYDIVPPVWDGKDVAFQESDINTVLITAANFIQYQPVDEAYPLDESTTVLELTETIIDWVDDQKPEAKIYIYGNWPEMDLQAAFPPVIPPASVIQNYHIQTIGSFADWWVDYQDELLYSRADKNVRLIPVGPIISKMLTELIPGEIPFDELYEDSDPHGRATLYFLAGMITYMAMYEKELPGSYMPSNIVHAGVRDNLELIRNYCWNELLTFNTDEGVSRVFCNTSPSSNSNTPVQKEMLVYPNPSSGDMVCSGIQDIQNLVFYNQMGQALRNIKVNGRKSISLNIEEFPEGIYLLKGLNANNEIISIKKIFKRN